MAFAPEEWRRLAPRSLPNRWPRTAAQRARAAWWWAYAGSMGLPNALDVLLDAAAQLRGAPFAFVLVGHRPRGRTLAERARSLPTSPFPLPSPRPRSRPCWARADIAYIGWQRRRSTASASRPTS